MEGEDKGEGEDRGIRGGGEGIREVGKRNGVREERVKRRDEEWEASSLGYKKQYEM